MLVLILEKKETMCKMYVLFIILGIIRLYILSRLVKTKLCHFDSL